MTIDALILAGGKATRFGGIAKHELVVDGQTIFARQVSVLAPRVGEILVSLATLPAAAPQPIAGYRTVVDAVAGRGPLGGIAAGLAAATAPWVLVVAGDMPFLTGEVIDLIVGFAALPGIDAVACSIDGLPEPLLCALRRAPAAAAVEGMLARGDRKASRLLTDAGLRVRWIDAELRAIDPELRALRNINAPADL